MEETMCSTEQQGCCEVTSVLEATWNNLAVAWQ